MLVHEQSAATPPGGAPDSASLCLRRRIAVAP
jgi:hypothetical protein